MNILGFLKQILDPEMPPMGFRVDAEARRLGDFDLMLVGREAGDWGEGQTGGLLAEELGWSCVSFAEQLEQSVSDPKILQVRRQTENGVEVLEAASPLVVTVTNH